MRRAYNSVGGRPLDQLLRHSLEPMKEETQENASKLRNFVGKYSGFFPQPRAPRKGGHLDEGVIITRRKSRGRMFREYWMSFSRRARKLAHLVEFGTAPHYQPNFKGGWQHPGSRAKPFARPAFESTKEEVVETVSRGVWLRIAASVRQGLRVK